MGMILGSATYIGYIFANVIFEPWIMYPTAALLGFGGAVLWTAEGVYITRLSLHYDITKKLTASSMGYFNGIFFFVFQSSMCIGNLVVAIMFYYDSSVTTVFVAGTVVAIAGTLLLILLHDVLISSASLDVFKSRNAFLNIPI